LILPLPLQKPYFGSESLSFFFKAVFVQVSGLFSFSTRRSVNVNPKGTHVAVQKLVNEIAKMLINSGTEVNFIKNG